MNRIEKFLQKLQSSEREEANIAITRLVAHDWAGLDIKKLKGFGNLFRCRGGNIRIIFEVIGGDIVIIKAGRRNDTTYSF